MGFNLTQVACVLVVTWTFWRLLRRLLVKSTLDNIRGPPSRSILTGNVGEYLNRHGSRFQMDIAQNYGPVVKLRGLFGGPLLCVSDPVALHFIFVKKPMLFDLPDDLLRVTDWVFGRGLLSTRDEHHRRQRKLLNPVFSMNALRDMLPIFNEVTYQLRAAISVRVEDGPCELDILDWMSRVILAMMGQGALRYSFDSLVQDTHDQYMEIIKSIPRTLLLVAWMRPLVPYVSDLAPAWLWRRMLTTLPYKPTRDFVQIVDSAEDMAKEIHEAKKLAFHENHDITKTTREDGESKNIMDILIGANMETDENERVPDAEVRAHLTTLIFASLDTTSNTLARILQRLAERQDIQNRLRQEVLEAGAPGNVPYDELMQLPYLNAVYRESLRLDPIATLVARTTLEDTILPLSQPVRGVDGTMIDEVPVEKGTPIILGTLGYQASKAYWGEDALEWKPERWLSPLPAAISNMPSPGVYSYLMAFAGGPRACIGFKFAETEIKAILFSLLSHFRFQLTEKSIFWNVAHVQYPTVGKQNDHAELPLLVTRLEGDVAPHVAC